MRPVSHLSKLRKTGTRRCLFLKSVVHSLMLPIDASGDRLITCVALETLNLWSSFARAFYISSVLGAKDCYGQRINIASGRMRSTASAINHAVITLKPFKQGTGPPWARRDEPTWHAPQTLLILLQGLAASNLRSVQIAFSYPTNLFDMLPTFRNFFAHRNEETARKVTSKARSLALSTQLSASEVLCTRLPGRPQHIISDWLDDLRAIMDYMCQ